MSQLVIFGAARIDAYMALPDNNAETLCDLDNQKCVLQLSYAGKIPVESVKFLLGGNGANVSVGTRRMGVDSLLVAEAGVGVMGDDTKRELEKEGVDTNFVTQTSDFPAGFGAVINYQGERTILSYYPPGEPPFPQNIGSLDAEWAYLTSVGDSFDKYYDQALKWLESRETKLAFNPGGRQIAKGHDWLAPYLQRTEVLIANREECEDIVDFSGSFGKEKELIQKLVESGVKKVILTDGTNGSYGFDGEKFYRLGIMPIDALERTGAGDATSSGLLSGLIKGKSMPEAMLWGMLNSTSVIGYTGPQEGLLHERDLDTWLKRAESMEVRAEEI